LGRYGIRQAFVPTRRHTALAFRFWFGKTQFMGDVYLPLSKTIEDFFKPATVLARSRMQWHAPDCKQFLGLRSFQRELF
jgi:hypothetical protein